MENIIPHTRLTQMKVGGCDQVQGNTRTLGQENARPRKAQSFLEKVFFPAAETLHKKKRVPVNGEIGVFYYA